MEPGFDLARAISTSPHVDIGTIGQRCCVPRRAVIVLLEWEAYCKVAQGIATVPEVFCIVGLLVCNGDDGPDRARRFPGRRDGRYGKPGESGQRAGTIGSRTVQNL